MSHLISVAEAQTQILSELEPVGVELIPVADSLGRTLGEDVAAPGDYPPFANSSMDGFAVRAEDVTSAEPPNPATLTIVADIPAGSPGNARVGPGQAARIMTGAPLPRGADAVVPVEDTSHSGGQVRIFRAVHAGDFVRPSGQDFHRGQVLLTNGRRLQPQDAGVLASIGQVHVTVYRRPRAALFSSGDELVLPGQPLGPGQIYESNQLVLAGLLQLAGAEVIQLGTVVDAAEEIEGLLIRAVKEKPDLIVSSAGVSVGAYDYVRQVIEARGELSFWRVNMRPGKPIAFGSYSGIPFFGLPGNPVSAYIGCRVFVCPAVDKLSGRAPSQGWHGRAVLTEPLDSDGRESYLRAIIAEKDGRWSARLAGHQGSGNLFGLTQANALLIVPSGVKSLPSGSEVNFWFLEA